VVGDEREREAGFLGGDGVAHEVARRMLLRREGVADLDHDLRLPR
jgi:hypothetical protein